MADVIPECWLPVVDYEGLYEVSDRGRVRRVGVSPYAKPGRILKPAMAGRGYLKVNLYGAGKPRQAYLHVLVTRAFLGPAPDGHEVNHRDGDKTHNAAANLEYITPLGNIRHASRMGLLRTGEQHQNTRLTVEQVAEIRRLYQPRTYSTHRLAREFGVSAQTIHNIIKGRTWTS